MKIDPNRIRATESTAVPQEPTKSESPLPASDQDSMDRMGAMENYYRDLFHAPTSAGAGESSGQSLNDKLAQLGDHQMTGMVYRTGGSFDETPGREPDETQPNNPLGVHEEKGWLGYTTWGGYADGDVTIENDSLKARGGYLAAIVLERYVNYSIETSGVDVGGHNLDVHADVDFSGGFREVISGYRQISIGKDTYVEAGQENFYGLVARMEGSLGAGEFAGVHGGVQGYLGVGGLYHMFAGFEDGKIKTDLQLGLALGIGMGMDVGFEVDVAAEIDAAAEILKQGADAAGQASEWFGDAAADTFGNVNQPDQQQQDNSQWTDDANNAIDQAAEAAHAAVDFVAGLVNW